MDKIDRIIGIVRALKEEMGVAAVSGAPTNSTNHPGGPVNIAGLPPDSPLVFPKRKIYLGLGSRKRWMIPKS
jgi:hypothetical protein